MNKYSQYSRRSHIFMAAIAASMVILTSCSAHSGKNVEPTTSATTSYKVPENCELSGVLAAFASKIPGAAYIPTQWNPAAGTDLAAVINNHGIACTYGVQSAEIGGRVMWVTQAQEIWNTKSAQWIKEGQIKASIAGVDASEIYLLKEGATAADGAHAWSANVLIGDLWLQVAGGFIQTTADAIPIIQAAISAARTN